MSDEGTAWLIADAEAKAGLVMQACRVAHEHSALACYERRYGLSLTPRPRETHHIRPTDRPLYASPDFGADPAAVAEAREALHELLRQEGEDELTA